MPHRHINTVETINSPLLLLRNIRDVMALPDSPQARLDKLVQVIASGFGADVCSIYLLRAGDVLELFASEGLNPDSVHLTRLQVSEGLVGEIAAGGEPMSLADAGSHPKFVYRPETGEEIYHSFAGVPIVHSHQVMGVLVVQGREARSFTEEQLEVLQTVAMVLAELVASGQLVSLEELNLGGAAALESYHMQGARFAPGLAQGVAVIHRPRIVIHRTVAENINEEEERLEHAIGDLQRSVDQLIQSSSLPEGDERREIMETYRLFTRDRGWLKQLAEAIHSGLTAEAAVQRVQDQLHARMAQVSSEYIRERMQDLDDLSNRLLQFLTGEKTGIGASAAELPDRVILVARSMGPAELLEYGQERLAGLVLEEGSATSHIVILARAMDIPVVGRIPGAATLIEQGAPVIVNGDSGEVYVRPAEDVEREVLNHLAQQRERHAAYAATQHLPPVTLDGQRISLNINIGLFLDAKSLAAEDVDGVGLYRTELPYMAASEFPEVEAQRKVYQNVLAQAGGKKVIFRSFDIGGDKRVPYLPIEKEENPAMGWRATRIGLDRPAILLRQFRALIEAASGQALYVMFPFITEVAEFDACHELLMQEWERAEKDGVALPAMLKVGTMLEIPALLFQLPALLQRVDFVSIGSNDLLQFLFACDRGSGRMTDRYDPLSPVVLRVLRDIRRQCEECGVEVGFCGEMARKPLEAMALIGIGMRQLSVPHSAVGPVKVMLRSLNVAVLEPFMDSLCERDERSVRSLLLAYAQDHGVMME